VIKAVEQLNITPGPWTCEGHRDEFGTYVVLESREEQSLIDRAWADAEDDLELDDVGQRQAAVSLHDNNNAGLIAAAPELYEVLRCLYEDHDEYVNELGDEYTTLKAARELLEKISAKMRNAE
jgi:hypothetical protein